MRILIKRKSRILKIATLVLLQIAINPLVARGADYTPVPIRSSSKDGNIRVNVRPATGAPDGVRFYQVRNEEVGCQI